MKAYEIFYLSLSSAALYAVVSGQSQLMSLWHGHSIFRICKIGYSMIV